MILAVLLFDFTEDDKDSILPSSILLRAVHVGFNSFSDRFALVPASIVLSTVNPSFYSYSFWFPVGPLTRINLAIWELTLAREEL